jgi:hypothetical protein
LLRAVELLNAKDKERRRPCAVAVKLSISLAGIYEDYLEINTIFYNFFSVMASSSKQTQLGK